LRAELIPNSPDVECARHGASARVETYPRRLPRLSRCEGGVNKYSEQHEVGALDPVLGWLRPGDLVSSDSIERFFHLAQEHEPQLLREAMAMSRREMLAGVK
jgi:hypothetical protein